MLERHSLGLDLLQVLGLQAHLVQVALGLGLHLRVGLLVIDRAQVLQDELGAGDGRLQTHGLVPALHAVPAEEGLVELLQTFGHVVAAVGVAIGVHHAVLVQHTQVTHQQLQLGLLLLGAGGLRDNVLTELVHAAFEALPGVTEAAGADGDTQRVDKARKEAQRQQGEVLDGDDVALDACPRAVDLVGPEHARHGRHALHDGLQVLLGGALLEQFTQDLLQLLAAVAEAAGVLGAVDGLVDVAGQHRGPVLDLELDELVGVADVDEVEDPAVDALSARREADLLVVVSQLGHAVAQANLVRSLPGSYFTHEWFESLGELLRVGPDGGRVPVAREVVLHLTHVAPDWTAILVGANLALHAGFRQVLVHLLHQGCDVALQRARRVTHALQVAQCLRPLLGGRVLQDVVELRRPHAGLHGALLQEAQACAFAAHVLMEQVCQLDRSRQPGVAHAGRSATHQLGHHLAHDGADLLRGRRHEGGVLAHPLGHLQTAVGGLVSEPAFCEGSEDLLRALGTEADPDQAGEPAEQVTEEVPHDAQVSLGLQVQLALDPQLVAVGDALMHAHLVGTADLRPDRRALIVLGQRPQDLGVVRPHLQRLAHLGHLGAVTVLTLAQHLEEVVHGLVVNRALVVGAVGTHVDLDGAVQHVSEAHRALHPALGVHHLRDHARATQLGHQRLDLLLGLAACLRIRLDRLLLRRLRPCLDLLTATTGLVPHLRCGRRIVGQQLLQLLVGQGPDVVSQGIEDLGLLGRGLGGLQALMQQVPDGGLDVRAPLLLLGRRQLGQDLAVGLLDGGRPRCVAGRHGGLLLLWRQRLDQMADLIDGTRRVSLVLSTEYRVGLRGRGLDRCRLGGLDRLAGQHQFDGGEDPALQRGVGGHRVSVDLRGVLGPDAGLELEATVQISAAERFGSLDQLLLRRHGTGDLGVLVLRQLGQTLTLLRVLVALTTDLGVHVRPDVVERLGLGSSAGHT